MIWWLLFDSSQNSSKTYTTYTLTLYLPYPIPPIKVWNVSLELIFLSQKKIFEMGKKVWNAWIIAVSTAWNNSVSMEEGIWCEVVNLQQKGLGGLFYFNSGSLLGLPASVKYCSVPLFFMIVRWTTIESNTHIHTHTLPKYKDDFYWRAIEIHTK